MNLETFAKMRALQSVHSAAGSQLVDHVLASESGAEYRAKLKRLQFDTAPETFDEVERICMLLNCSKREFLDMAVEDAIAKADSTFFNTFKDVAGYDFGQRHEDVPC